MNIKLLGSLIILVNVNLAEAVAKKIFITSIPKSGTHLIIACIKQITHYRFAQSRFRDHLTIDADLLKKLKPGFFYLSHAQNTLLNNNLLEEHDMSGFFIYRDPRDVLFSAAKWIVEGHWWVLKNNALPEMKGLSFEEIFELLITGADSCYMFTGKAQEPTIANWYKAYLPWKNNKRIYTTSFERLVGPLGGGSKEAQVIEIKNIGQHLGKILSDVQAEEIGNNIFGKLATFRDGQIGKGKKYLNEHLPLKKLFNEVAGALLIELGYEKDLNW